MNKDVLKKHHFWVLAGLVPVFVLLAVLLTWTGASSAVSAEESKIKGEKDAIKGKNPKGTAYEQELIKQKDVLAGKVGQLWEANWRDQRDLVVWPKDGDRGRLANFLYDPTIKPSDGRREYLKFGTPLENGSSVFEVFQNDKNYLAPFEQAAKLVEPTQVLGGWQSLFRYIRDWGTRTPESEVLWLTLEDLWVQRGLMLPVKTVNDAVAAFHPVATKPGPDGKAPENKFTFRSRIWEVEFEIAQLGSKKILKAKLTNITDRLQPLGGRNSMYLDVWFDSSPNQEKGAEFPFRIERESVRAGETIEVQYLPTFHDLEDQNPTKVTKVAQKFDSRTVPIRRIDRLVLGYLDNRHQYAELKPPPFIKVVEVSPTASDPGMQGPGGSMPGEPGIPGGGRFPGGIAGPSGPGGPGGPGGIAGPGALFGGGGSGGWEGFRDATKRRYIDVSDQVRRIPVAMVLVLDQDYERDLLIALANSKLRFQVTQYHAKRFRGSLGSAADASDPTDTDPFTPGGYGQPGVVIGSGFGDEPMSGPGRGFPGRGMPGGMRPGGIPGQPSSGIAPPSGLPGQPSSGIAPPSGLPGQPPGGVPFPGGRPGEFGGAFPGAPGGIPGVGPGGFGGFSGDMFGSTGVGESSAASGLIEISIYGVVTLYERFEKAKAETPDAASPTPTPTAPLNPTTPAPTDPMTPAPPPIPPTTPMGLNPDKPKSN